ncbi:DUF2336 domain-containing protein [Parapedomonas caeni]|jgi:uncharacterized protein (DUF2336 family)
MSNEDVTRLLVLAADRSREARMQLVNTIVDFFLPDNDRLTEQQRALMTDVLCKLIGSIEMDVRRNLVAALQRSGVELPELERLLASDEIEVARPVLEKSKALRDPELIEIIRTRSDEHRLAIAVRDHVSAEVSDALIEHGSNDVIERLIRNEDAVLSRRAMEYLVAESRRVDRFQEPLLGRNDLPGDLAHRMYWWVSAALRRHILRHFTIPADVLDRALEDSTRRAVAEHDHGQGAQARALRLARRLMDLGELTDPFLLSALRQQRVTVFAAGLAERAGITFQMAWRLISDRGAESFIVLAKAIDMDRQTMTSLVLLLAEFNNPESARRPDVITTILKLFDDLSTAQARDVLRVWQRDTALVRALDDVTDDAA